MREVRAGFRSIVPVVDPGASSHASSRQLFDTAAGAYAKLDAIAAKLQREGAPPDYLELCVVDTDRQPIARWVTGPVRFSQARR